MADAALEPSGDAPHDRARRYVILSIASSGLVILLMMLAGLSMRLAQSGWIDVDPAVFYRLLTLHGTGMIGAAILGGAAVMWYYSSEYVRISSAILGINLVLFWLGVVAILAADLIGGFGAAWTILYPLPAHSQSTWPVWAAELHLGGLLLVGIGTILVCLELGRGIVHRYGGITRGLGWHVLFGGAPLDEAPAKPIVAATMSIIVMTVGMVTGAAVLIMMLVNLVNPAIEINPLLAKNLIYQFGHIIANATIYMAVAVVYVLLPKFAHRKWKMSKTFLASWTLSTTMVMVIYPHHMFMDFVMPKWVLAVAQIFSYMNSFPILIVSGFGALALVYRSGIRWDLVSGLLILSMFGWMAGVVPAVIDATIAVNSVMHNTMWVPGHFHFYMLLGLLPMLFAFMIHLARGEREETAPSKSVDWLAVLYLLFGLGFVSMFLTGGWASVPRRWAVHYPEWQDYDRVAAVMASGVLLIAIVFFGMFVSRLSKVMQRA